MRAYASRFILGHNLFLKVSNVVSNVVSNLVSSVVSNLDAQCDAQLGVQWPNKRCPRILWHVVFAIEGMSVVPSFRKVLANDTGVAENASSVWVSLRLAGIFFVQLMRTGVKCGPLDVFRARFGLPVPLGDELRGFDVASLSEKCSQPLLIQSLLHRVCGPPATDRRFVKQASADCSQMLSAHKIAVTFRTA